MRIYVTMIFLACLLLPGCGTWVSGRPIYPANWPSLDIEHQCPDLSGKYRALSNEAAPLVYPSGEHPREMFFFVTFGAPQPVPPLGRRILPWHLAGVFSDKDNELWNALSQYSADIEANNVNGSEDAEDAWVEVKQISDSTIEVHAGLHGGSLLNFIIRKEPQGLWRYKSHVFGCKEGGLRIVSSFPPPAIENPSGLDSADIGAVFTFYRANDKSLVALEEAYTGVSGGNMVFNKWWRWPRAE